MGVECGACGAGNPARARFCLECGAAVSPVAAPVAETRKTVTVLFCDVTGSTALGEARDAEAMRAVMQRYFATMSRVIEAHGGTVEKFIGDAVMAVFGVPVLHEDDAARAVRAAAGMRAALDGLNDTLERDHGMRLACRIGVNTGEVVVGTDTGSGSGSGKGTVATGDAVNVAARLEQAAAPGQVLLGEPTWALVRHSARTEPVDPLTVKGKTGHLRAWALLDVTSPEAPARPAGHSPLVGRDRELALLTQAWERSRADRRTQLVTVLGAAGVGKTRLVEEILHRHREVTVLAGRCLSYGEDIVFWPLQQMLRQAANLTGHEDDATARARLRGLVADDPEPDRVVERLAPLAGLRGTPAEADETHWALRRLVEALGRRGPLVVVLDDVHWAEPALLDTVEHLADWTRDTPLLLVCLARPEFLDDHPQWAGGKLNTTTILLEPLPGDAAATLLDNLLAGARLDPRVRGQILTAAGGMPLFVEQMLAMLVDDGLLSREEESRSAPATVEVPPTISALLAARLDRLPAADRSALEAASVVGATFYLDAVAEMVGIGAGDVARVLMSLTRKELVRPDRSDLPGEDGFRFLHVLVRDAAYAAIPKARRAELHEHFARWLDKRGETLGLDVDQFVGHHLEQVVRLRAQLGPLSAETRGLASTAAHRLAAAGQRLPAADPRSAASLYDRAAALLTVDDAERIDHLRAAGAALEQAGDLQGARSRYETTEEAALDLGDERSAELCRVALVVIRGHLDADRDLARDLAFVEEAMQRFRAAQDDEALLTAGWAKVNLLNELSTWEPIVDLVEELLPLAERRGDVLARDTLVRRKGSALYYSPAPLQQCLEWIDSHPSQVNRSTQISQAFTRAAVLAQLDRVAECRRTLARGESLLADARSPLGVLVAAFAGGATHQVLGDLAEAERVIRRGIETLEQIGERSWLSSLAPMLGDVRLVLGDHAGACALAEVGRTNSPATDRFSQAQWRSLLARLEAAEGRTDSATALADEAVVWIGQTDQVNSIADVRAARAEVLGRAGRIEDARADLHAALELYERKGNRPAGRRTRDRLAALL